MEELRAEQTELDDSIAISSVILYLLLLLHPVVSNQSDCNHHLSGEKLLYLFKTDTAPRFCVCS